MKASEKWGGGVTEQCLPLLGWWGPVRQGQGSPQPWGCADAASQAAGRLRGAQVSRLLRCFDPSVHRAAPPSALGGHWGDRATVTCQTSPWAVIVHVGLTAWRPPAPHRRPAGGRLLSRDSDSDAASVSSTHSSPACSCLCAPGPAPVRSWEWASGPGVKQSCQSARRCMTLQAGLRPSPRWCLRGRGAESHLPAVSSQTEDAQKDTDVAETLLGTGCALGPSPPGHMVCASLSSLPRAFLLPFFSRRSAPTAQTTSAPPWAKITGTAPSSAFTGQ